MDIIPGTGMLGFGVDAVGRYTRPALKAKLLEHRTMDAQTYSDPQTGKQYRVPDNMSVIEVHDARATTHTFASEQSFKSFFTSKLDIQGSYGAVTGEFEAAYGNTTESSASYSWAFTEAIMRFWTLQAQSYAPDRVSQDFLNDPLVANLPSEFSPATRAQFFSVLRKYGTHWIASITMGSSLYYYAAVQTTQESSETTISAKVELEYNTVLIKTKAEAEADWKKLGESWAKSRRVNIVAQGGSTDIIRIVSPAYGDNEHEAYEKWRASVRDIPGPAEYQLAPLSYLVPAKAQSAMEQATHMYMNGALIADATVTHAYGKGPNGSNWTTSGTVISMDGVVWPDPSPQPPLPAGTNLPVPGLRIVVVDAQTWQVELNTIFYSKNPLAPDADLLYVEALNAIKKLETTNYYVALAIFGVALSAFPPSDFVTWVSSCGASLEAWREKLEWASGDVKFSTYVMVGRSATHGGASSEFAFAQLHRQSAHAEVLRLLFAGTAALDSLDGED